MHLENSTNHYIVDKNGLIVGVLVGKSSSQERKRVFENATHHMHNAREYCSMHGHEEHRRGTYDTLTAGISRGGGQPVRVCLRDDEEMLNTLQRPMNMKARNRRERRAIRRLLMSQSIRRIANSQSSERGRHER